jgi:hypothetical protein
MQPGITMEIIGIHVLLLLYRALHILNITARVPKQTNATFLLI